MQKMRDRAQTHFPSVLLTLISIIQALALELMWSKLVESEFLWSWSFQSVLGWGMISVSFLGILQIWVMYSTLVMGFAWQPYLRDSIIPFIIGIQEFMLISLIGSEFTAIWLYVLGSVFVTASWVSNNSLRRARSDPENAEFFGTVEPATMRDHAPTIAVVVILLLFGIGADINGDSNWIPLVGIVFANIVLFSQIMILRRVWRSVMGLTGNKTEVED